MKREHISFLASLFVTIFIRFKFHAHLVLITITYKTLKIIEIIVIKQIGINVKFALLDYS
jgi:hypothetical protein